MRNCCTVLLALLAIGLCRGAAVTTTESSSTTTSVPTTTVAEANSTNDSNCTALSVCYTDSECGSGICLGAFVGTCDCGACLNFLSCEDDSVCGGLKGSCNNVTSKCSCIQGYKANGFPTFSKALTELCNTKQCTNETADKNCFGLPCHFGHCVCDKTGRDANGMPLGDSTASDLPQDNESVSTTESVTFVPVTATTPDDTIDARASDDDTTTEKPSGSSTTLSAASNSSETTTKPSITTTAIATIAATNATGNDTCKALADCYGDDDCGSGRCLGVFVGTCNCNACLNFLSCEDDSVCGGLKGACNTKTSKCSCTDGYKANGFPTFSKALSSFCNIKQCNKDNADDECFGLPCHAGHCFC